MIIYASVYRSSDAVVLAENYSSELGGNVPQVNMALMEYLQRTPAELKDGERKTFLQQNENEQQDFFWGFLEACGMEVNDGGSSSDDLRYYFHVMHKGGVFYSCLSDDPDPNEHKVNLAFLDHVCTEFTRLYKPKRIKRANAYGMEKDFKHHLRSAMHFYNSNNEKLRRDKKVQYLSTKIEKLKDVMGENINMMLRRGETLESMDAKADVMRRDSILFKKQSTSLKNKVRLRLWKMRGCIALVVALLIYTALVSACGFGFQYCRVRGDSNSGNDDDTQAGQN